MESYRKRRLVTLFILFNVLALYFWAAKPGGSLYIILDSCAVIWFAVELTSRKPSSRRLWNAFLAGLFLMLFDFTIQNVGGLLGYWNTYGSIYAIYFVPVEIMFLCLVGGMAWSLYLPDGFSLKFSLIDILFFSTYGMLGEFILSKNNLMVYVGGWTSLHAFIGYAITWIILHLMQYKIIGK